MEIAISRSSAMSRNAFLIFDMSDINGVLFLKVRFLFLSLTSTVYGTGIVPFMAIHALILVHFC